jgi:uncharacterized repeat protein (TIGR01451 family)
MEDRAMTDVRLARSHRARLVAIWLTLMLAIGVAPARAAGATWLVNRPGDSADDGDLATRQGTLRFALTHAVSGDLVAIGDVHADTITVGSTLIVPPGVAVGGRRDQPDCGSYRTPRISIEDATFTISPMMRLGAGATLRNIAIAGGNTGVRIDGANVEVCGVGLGIKVDGDGQIISLPPPANHAVLIVDGDHALIRRNYLKGPVSVTTNGGDTRIGDTISGTSDMNDGVRAAAVTVLADSGGAAQRVTIRDPFPRALHGLAGNGVPGGDDDPTHANNWAMTPAIISAYTNDHFATAQVRGIASPHSLVDIYFDNQLDVKRQTPIVADAAGVFTFTGALPPMPPDVLVIAGSTLDDPAHPNRVGSSSVWSNAVQVTEPISTSSIQLAPATLSFTAVLTDPAPPAQHLAVTVPLGKPHLTWQTTVSTTDGLSWLSATPISAGGNGTITVTVDQSGLQPGAYHGTVTVFDPNDPADRAMATVTLVALSGEPALGATGGVVDLNGPPVGPAHPGDVLRFTVAMTNFGAVEVTNIGSANLLIPPGYAVVTGSGSVSGGSGFVATDEGFIGGVLAPGASAAYSLDVNVPITAQNGMAVFSVEVYANKVVSIPVVGRMRITSEPRPAPQPIVWVPLVVRCCSDRPAL